MSQQTSPWKNLPPMTTPRRDFAAVALRGKLYAVGGRGAKGVRDVLDTIEFFDFDEGRWTQAPARMSEGRFGCAAAVIGNSIYVAGGQDYAYRQLDYVEAFDVDTGLWGRITPMNTKREGCAAVAVGDELIVFGGYYDGHSTCDALQTAELFKRSKGRWVYTWLGGGLDDDEWLEGDEWWEYIPRMINRRYRCAAVVISDKVYIIGGLGGVMCGDRVWDTVEVFDLKTRIWTLLPHDMATRRQGCAAAAMGNYLIVAGGEGGVPGALDAVEMYNVEAETWTELPPMSTERSGCAAVSYGGSVFVMGGEDDDETCLDSVEAIHNDDAVKEMLLDWSEGSWRDEVAPILHQYTLVVHKIGVDVPLMPTLLSNVAKEEQVQTMFGIIRGEIPIFKHTSKESTTD